MAPRTVDNPPSPWRSAHVELLAPEPLQPPQVFEEEARSILTRNDSPDVPFTWSVNPYRGCHHGCAYCYARPTHQWLDFGAGTDFERKLVVKVNAPELLRRELRARETELRGQGLAFSGITDCYQPLEASYELTRRCLQVCADARQRAGIVTKGALVARDRDVLARLHERAGAFVHVSVPSLDPVLARALEPWAPSPERRLRAMRELADAGVPVGVAVAPVIPGWNDHQIPRVLQAASAHGASAAFLVLLRLPAEVEPVFVERLHDALPERAEKVMAAVRELRGGRTNDPRFHARMEGQGPRWQAIDQLFRIWCKKLSLRDAEALPAAIGFRPSLRPRQQVLFGGGDAPAHEAAR